MSDPKQAPAPGSPEELAMFAKVLGFPRYEDGMDKPFSIPLTAEEGGGIILFSDHPLGPSRTWNPRRFLTDACELADRCFRRDWILYTYNEMCQCVAIDNDGITYANKEADAREDAICDAVREKLMEDR